MNRPEIYTKAKERIRLGESATAVFDAIAAETGKTSSAVASLYYREARRDAEALVNAGALVKRGRPRRPVGPADRARPAQMVELRVRVEQLEGENARLRTSLDLARRALVERGEA